MLARVPLGRFPKPQDITDVALFLMSPLTSDVTGQPLRVKKSCWG